MPLSSGSALDSKIDLFSAWKTSFDRFRSKLSPQELQQWTTTNQQPTTYHELLDGVKEASSIVEMKRYPFTRTIQSILNTINQYAVVTDIMVQYDPQNTAFVWGAFRFILLAAVQEGATCEKVVEHLDRIARIVFRTDTYTALFAHHETSAKDILRQIYDGLVALFTEVLIFLFRAMRFFKKSTFRRYISATFKPYHTEFQGTYDSILQFEKDVQDNIQLLKTEFDILQQEVENGKWLRHAEAGFSSDFKRLCSEHVDGTCQWFLQNTKVEQWMGSHSVPGLWVSGKPGCGKSTMASQLIHNLATSPLLVVRILCKAGTENRCDVLSILRNILFQLVESAVTALEKRKLHSIITSERMNSKDSFASSIPNLWSTLRQLLQSTGGCVCVIDGLDECSNTEQEINDFIVKLTDVFGVSPTTKAVVFSRLGIPGIGDSVCLWERLSITVENVEDDIERFVSVKLEASPKLRNPKVKDRLFKPLIHGSEGMVLWTRLMISELESNHYQVEKVLKEPPAGLKALYKGILQRLSNTGSESLRQQNTHALRLVLAAARPLSLDEFSFAVEMLKGLPNHADYDLGEDDARHIINGVAPLIIIAPDNTVQIVHASLKDFLVTSTDDRDSGLGYCIFRPSELHGPVTIALLSYLAFPCFSEELVEDAVEIDTKYPLLEYSSSQLIWHITKVDDSYQECLHQLGALFKSTEGWRWLQRLLYTYNVSMGHLQIFQSELKHWLNALSRKTMLDRDTVLDRDICDDFLVYLCKMRSNQARQCEADHNVFALEAISTLADVYECQGWWKEAEELQVQVMETRKRVLGQVHPDTLLSMGNLAAAYLGQGRWKEAEELEVQVMETRKRVLGQEHPHTLWSMGNLAAGYWNQGRWKEAEELEVQVMETRKRVQGQEHPHTLLSMGNLAAGYQGQGRWKEAEELEVQVMEMRKRVLGQEHPNTLSSMGNLAEGYRNQGRWKEAEELQVQVMETRKRVLGQEHPHTLWSMDSLAGGYQNQGRWKEAEELGVQVMETRKRVLGQEHPDTLMNMGNLASMFKSQGRRDEATTLLEQVVALLPQRLGEDHPHSKLWIDTLKEWRDNGNAVST